MICTPLRQTLARAALFATVFCALCIPCKNTRGDTALATGFVNSTTLNLRPDPNTDRSPLGTLSYGDAVTVYELNGVWCRVDVPAKKLSGYVSAKHLAVDASAGIYGIGVTTGKVHVRSQSSAESASLGMAENKTGLILESVQPNGWWKARIPGGLSGYISNRYVEVLAKSGKNAKTGEDTGVGTPGAITGDQVNFRSGPSRDTASLAKLDSGTSVRILTDSGKWYQVKVPTLGKTGYVYKTYVKATAATVQSPTPTAPPAASVPVSGDAGKAAYINAQGVNCRSGPSASNQSLILLSVDTRVTVLGQIANWCKVRVDATGAGGYVSSAFLTYY